MPPRPKFTRDEIVEAALAVVSDGNLDALTARTLAKRLGCSTRPIFTVFADMDELKAEISKLAAQRVEERSLWAMERSGSIVQAGVQTIRIAIEDPGLYRLSLDYNRQHNDGADVFLDENGERVQRYTSYVCDCYGLTPEQARAMLRHTHVHFCGVRDLCMSGRYAPTDEELESFLSEELEALAAHAKAGGLRTDWRPAEMPQGGGDAHDAFKVSA